MVFNTGAALLDAIVLAIVDKETEGTYGYKITQDVRSAIEISACMSMTSNMAAGTADITKSQNRADGNFYCTSRNGAAILQK